MDKNNRLLIASILALVTTSFGFIVRAFLLADWTREYGLSETQAGALAGAGLFPFALSIILFSLIIDKVGYGRSMAIAWVGHVASAIITMTAKTYGQLYVGTFLFALSNGVVEAVTNPMVATVYAKDKVKALNWLHSGWAGGLVLGGILFIAMGGISNTWKIGLFLIPAVIYGVMFLGCTFPVQERVTAGVSYRDMLKEFGWAGCLIVSYFVAGALGAVLSAYGMVLSDMVFWIITLVPTIIFAVMLRSFGRPMFVFMLLIMILLATTELGTDSWVTAMLTPILGSSGAWVLIYTSAIMLVLRIFGAGPLVHKLTPPGLLTLCSILAAIGLIMLANAGTSTGMIFMAATLYGVGKTFFWPTTLGLVSEQFPRGGALTLNAMGGMGMIAVGVLGGPLLGALQDQKIDKSVTEAKPALVASITMPAQSFPLVQGLKEGFTTVGPYRPLDVKKVEALPEAEKTAVNAVVAEAKQKTLANFSIFPILMAVGFGLMLGYFVSKGGYRAVDIGGGGGGHH